MKRLVCIAALTLPLCACGVFRIRGNTRPVSAYEKAVASNAVLAETNHGIARAIIATNQIGGISNSSAKEATEYQFALAKYDEELSKILAQGPEYAKAHADQIKGLLGLIKGSANDLLHSSAAGFKNPNSQQDLTALANEVIAMAIAIVQDLADQGVIQ